MRILGIETSCDETAISIIEADGTFDDSFRFRVLGDMTLSQAELHAEYGGVYPNLAKREHAKNFTPILTTVLKEAGLLLTSKTPVPSDKQTHLESLLEREPDMLTQLSEFFSTHDKPEIDAIAVTTGPGLEPALWVGINAARALAYMWDVPIVAANHMEGHITLSSMKGDTFGTLEFPALALLISGGHTEIILMKEWMKYEKIGETRDDAVGEAFDKTARLLDIPYPGGPTLSNMAAEARSNGEPDLYLFPRPMINSDDLDFSFSGLKTAVRMKITDKDLTEDDKKSIARGFEDAVTDVLVAKTRSALSKYKIRTLIVGGGVSANTYIREQLRQLLEAEFPNTSLLLPPPESATDNAMMIALAGYFHAIKSEYIASEDLVANGTKQLS